MKSKISVLLSVISAVMGTVRRIWTRILCLPSTAAAAAEPVEWSAQGQKWAESEVIACYSHRSKNAHQCLFLTAPAGPAGDLTGTWALWTLLACSRVRPPLLWPHRGRRHQWCDCRMPRRRRRENFLQPALSRMHTHPDTVRRLYECNLHKIHFFFF